MPLMIRAEVLDWQSLLLPGPGLKSGAPRQTRSGRRPADAILSYVKETQRLWRDVYTCKPMPTDGSQWDRLFADGGAFQIGDTPFMPDSGTARADFPGGNARPLWASIQNILNLPHETRVLTGHDCQPGGREPRCESTVGEQMRSNVHLARVDLGYAKPVTEPFPCLSSCCPFR
jgi:glyoxylase-like metal-dependent hydrolase (beta-lactamase superfamily II)